MKLRKKPSLRMRITLFTGAVFLAASALLTGLSMYHAQNQFMVVSYTYRGLAEPPKDAPITDATKITVTSTTMTTATISDSEAVAANADVSSYTVQPSDAIVIKAARQFNLLSIVSMLVISLVGMLLVYWLAGKSLSPVRTLTQAVSDITEDTLNQRISAPAVHDEIGTLTQAFNDMLSRLDESFFTQKRFASNAAHELKTPIATIKANLDVLEFEQSPALSNGQPSFAAIKRTVGRLSDLIDDLMTLADTDYPLHTESISLQAMLKSIGKELTPVYAAKNICITYAFGDAESFVVCNETLAYRLFSNLMENALKYNRDHGSITLSVKQTESSCIVTISDTGLGIDATDIEHIWDAFYCVDKSRSRKLGGAGLGLSIVKSIAQRFGWDISVTSAVSVGTTVTIVCTDAA